MKTNKMPAALVDKASTVCTVSGRLSTVDPGSVQSHS